MLRAVRAVLVQGRIELSWELPQALLALPANPSRAAAPGPQCSMPVGAGVPHTPPPDRVEHAGWGKLSARPASHDSEQCSGLCSEGSAAALGRRACTTGEAR